MITKIPVRFNWQTKVYRDLDFDLYKNATLNGHSCTITDHITIKMA